ncbi:MAG: alpha/beta family hydrolase [Myxococcota bacterium]
METVARGLGDHGVATLRYQFPYMEKGSRRPDPPGIAEATVRAAVAEAGRLAPTLPIVAGGKSYGGRMTSQAQARQPIPGLRGIVFFGFPLHPAGKPSDDRGEHLSQVDLNLLAVLDVLLREQSVTRTARQLHRTPSAVSHALNRLRELLGDELLVRDGRRMVPTVRGERLAGILPRALEQLAHALVEPEPFDPATSSRTFRLAAPDFMAPLVPPLLQEVGRVAPAVRIELAPFGPTAVRDVTEGRYDGLIAPAALQNEAVRSVPLGSWPWAVYGRAGHPAFKRWSLKKWSAHPHLQVRTSVLRGQGPIDRLAEQQGIRRVIGAVVPHFSLAAPVLAQTDLLLTVPSVAMGGAAEAYDLGRRKVPFELPRMQLALFRSATTGEEPGVQWFLERVRSASRKLG